jgi:hypothetical protein
MNERQQLIKAAERLEYLYERSKHIPTDLIHDRGYRVGWVHEKSATGELVAQFHYGGAAEVFLTLGPAVLPILADVLRTEAGRAVPNGDAVRLADHILKTEADS